MCTSIYAVKQIYSISFHVIFFFIHKSHCHALWLYVTVAFLVYTLWWYCCNGITFTHAHGIYVSYVHFSCTLIYTNDAACIKRPDLVVFVHFQRLTHFLFPLIRLKLVIGCKKNTEPTNEPIFLFLFQFGPWIHSQNICLWFPVFFRWTWNFIGFD